MLKRCCKKIASIGAGMFMLFVTGIAIANAAEVITGQSGSPEKANTASVLQTIYSLIPVLLPIILVIIVILLSKLIRHYSGPGENDETGNADLYKALEISGFRYDPLQDIFYSIMHPWQRSVGYCELYDIAAAPMSMIIDCEPVYFEYSGKKWLVEFWKGQYGLTTGCEVGVYTDAVELNISDVFNGTFYNAATDADRLFISYTLRKNGVELFKREGEHWWLTGFILGVFSEPWELSADIEITLKDIEMCDAFICGLLKAGYPEESIEIYDSKVCVSFNKPYSRQPITRSPDTDWIIQRKNELLCKMYQSITGPYNNVLEKLKVIEKQEPELFKKILDMGKSKLIFEQYDIIKNYLR